MPPCCSSAPRRRSCPPPLRARAAARATATARPARQGPWRASRGALERAREKKRNRFSLPQFPRRERELGEMKKMIRRKKKLFTFSFLLAPHKKNASLASTRKSENTRHAPPLAIQGPALGEQETARGCSSGCSLCCRSLCCCCGPGCRCCRCRSGNSDGRDRSDDDAPPCRPRPSPPPSSSHAAQTPRQGSLPGVSDPGRGEGGGFRRISSSSGSSSSIGSSLAKGRERRQRRRRKLPLLQACHRGAGRVRRCRGPAFRAAPPAPPEVEARGPRSRRRTRQGVENLRREGKRRRGSAARRRRRRRGREGGGDSGAGRGGGRGGAGGGGAPRWGAADLRGVCLQDSVGCFFFFASERAGVGVAGVKARSRERRFFSSSFRGETSRDHSFDRKTLQSAFPPVPTPFYLSFHSRSRQRDSLLGAAAAYTSKLAFFSRLLTTTTAAAKGKKKCSLESPRRRSAEMAVASLARLRSSATCSRPSSGTGCSAATRQRAENKVSCVHESSWRRR